MNDQNKQTARRMIEEVFSQGRYEVLNELVDAKMISHDPALPMQGSGPTAVRAIVEMLRTAFPDLRMTVDDQFGEGERVMTRWTARATHRGPFMGRPATNKTANVTGVTVERFQNGKIVESWVQWDSAGLMQQLGLRVEDTPRTAAGDGARARPI